MFPCPSIQTALNGFVVDARSGKIRDVFAVLPGVDSLDARPVWLVGAPAVELTPGWRLFMRDAGRIYRFSDARVEALPARFAIDNGCSLVSQYNRRYDSQPRTYSHVRRT